MSWETDVIGPHYRIRGESGYTVDLRDPFEEALGVLRHLAVEKGEKLRIYRVDAKDGRERLVELGEAQPTYWISAPGTELAGTARSVKRRRRTA